MTALKASPNATAVNKGQKNNKVRRYQYIVFVVWLAFIILAAKYFVYDRLVDFDPHNKLSGSPNTIISQINAELSLNNKPLKNTIIHFTSDNCACSSYSTDHKNIINRQATDHNFSVMNVELTKQQNSIIPSTPAILILDDKGELVYLGPYAEGLDCSVSNSIVDVVLKNYSRGFNSNLVINNAKGCYCNI